MFPPTYLSICMFIHWTWTKVSQQDLRAHPRKHFMAILQHIFSKYDQSSVSSYNWITCRHLLPNIEPTMSSSRAVSENSEPLLTPLVSESEGELLRATPNKSRPNLPPIGGCDTPPRSPIIPKPLLWSVLGTNWTEQQFFQALLSALKCLATFILILVFTFTTSSLFYTSAICVLNRILLEQSYAGITLHQLSHRITASLISLQIAE